MFQLTSSETRFGREILNDLTNVDKCTSATYTITGNEKKITNDKNLHFLTRLLKLLTAKLNSCEVQTSKATVEQVLYVITIQPTGTTL